MNESEIINFIAVSIVIWRIFATIGIFNYKRESFNGWWVDEYTKKSWVKMLNVAAIIVLIAFIIRFNNIVVF